MNQITRTISISMRESLYELIRSHADERGMSATKFISFALADWFNKPELGIMRPQRLGRPAKNHRKLPAPVIPNEFNLEQNHGDEIREILNRGQEQISAPLPDVREVRGVEDSAVPFPEDIGGIIPHQDGSGE